jgi:D-glycero-D-manno-heptose 1,7-bisphosphate phosphatase
VDVTIRQCAILVGGLGTRLGALTKATPKPLLPIGDRPFLAWLMREFVRFGVEEFVLLTGYLSAQVDGQVEALAAMLPRAARVVISREPERAGTGGAVYYARDRLAQRFLLCNGDSLFDCNIARLLADAAGDGPEVAGRLVLRRIEDASRYGLVELDGDRVVAFHARPPAPAAGAGAAGAGAAGAGTAGGATAVVGTANAGAGRAATPSVATGGVINAGIYAYDRRLLDELTPACSLEHDIMPRLAARGALRGTVAEGYFRDIGIPEDLARAQQEMPLVLRRRTLFLDRDGVINVDHGWVGVREKFEWMPGAREAIRAATEAGWHVFVVTNQSGIARGHYTEADMHDLHAWMTDEIRRAGGTLDDLRFCPFHADAVDAAYRDAAHPWRKPAPGMLLDLIRAWQIDPARAVLVGDQDTDLAAAAAAGVAARKFTGGNLLDEVGPLLRQPRA